MKYVMLNRVSLSNNSKWKKREHEKEKMGKKKKKKFASEPIKKSIPKTIFMDLWAIWF